MNASASACPPDPPSAASPLANTSTPATKSLLTELLNLKKLAVSIPLLAINPSTNACISSVLSPNAVA